MGTFVGLDLGRAEARVASATVTGGRDNRKKAELLAEAEDIGIKVPSRATKQQIARLIEEAKA